MTSEELAALLALAEGATPGPWEWVMDSGSLALRTTTPGDGDDHILTPHVCESCARRDVRCLGPNEANAAYIAALNPATVRRLIAQAQSASDEAAAREFVESITAYPLERRRRYVPMPDDFDAMSPEAFEGYVERIGFADEIRAALRERRP